MGRLHRMKPEVHVEVVRQMAIRNGVSEMIVGQVVQQLLPIYQHLHATGNYFVCEEGKSHLLQWFHQQPGAVTAPQTVAPNPAMSRAHAPVATLSPERPRQVPGGPVPVQAPMMNPGGNGHHVNADNPPSLTDAPPAPPTF